MAPRTPIRSWTDLVSGSETRAQSLCSSGRPRAGFTGLERPPVRAEKSGLRLWSTGRRTVGGGSDAPDLDVGVTELERRLWRTTLPATGESMVVHRLGRAGRFGYLFNFTWATDMRVRAVTPLAVLLRLGSRPTYPSRKRPIRLLSWLGFNALIGSTGTLNSRWEVYSKPSPARSAYASCYMLCVSVSPPVTLLGGEGGHAGLVSPGSFSWYCPPAGAGTQHCRPKSGYRRRRTPI